MTRNGGDLDQTATILSSTATQAQILRRESGTIQVEVLGGPMDGQRRRVAKPSFTIGRGLMNDLPLHLDPQVSAKHVRIVKEDQHYWLEDLGSSNGTFIGDQRIDGRALIGPGTVFVLGSTSLEFLPA